MPDEFLHASQAALTDLYCRCFKREFPEVEALKMWEACWANYLTDYFHLFLCLAIISIYSDDVIAQDLRTDEMLLYFSSLAMFMDGELILRKVNYLVTFSMSLTFLSYHFSKYQSNLNSWDITKVHTDLPQVSHFCFCCVLCVNKRSIHHTSSMPLTVAY